MADIEKRAEPAKTDPADAKLPIATNSEAAAKGDASSVDEKRDRGVDAALELEFRETQTGGMIGQCA